MKLLYTFFICILQIAVFSQRTDEMGDSTGIVQPFEITANFTVGKYVAFKEANALKFPKWKKFDGTQLKSARNLLQAQLMCNTKEWYQNLLQDSSEGNPPLNEFNYRSSKEFKTDYQCEILVEFTFGIANEVYTGFIVRHNTIDGKVITMPYLCVLQDDGWQITTECSMAEFAGLLLLKPKYFQLFLNGELWKEKEFESYLYREYFNLEKGFTLKAFIGRVRKNELTKFVIPNGANYKFKNDITLEFTESIHAGIRYVWNKTPGALYTFKKSGSVFVKNGFLKPEYYSYQKWPELALGSWMFDKDTLERLKHITDPTNLDIDFTHKGYHLTTKMGSIRFKEKYIFRKDNVIYALIYFENWLSRNEPKSDERLVTSTGYIGGIYRFLLKFENGEWKIETRPPSVLVKFVFLVDHINRDTQLAAFIESSENNQINKFVAELNLNGLDNTINLNGSYNYLKMLMVPKEVKPSYPRNDMRNVFPIPKR
jgi:hypothetical protein